MTTIDPRIVGIWQLKSTMGRDDAGKLLPEPYGPLAMGLVTFQADGRMMAVLCDGRAALDGDLQLGQPLLELLGTPVVDAAGDAGDADAVGREAIELVRDHLDDGRCDITDALAPAEHAHSSQFIFPAATAVPL